MEIAQRLIFGIAGLIFGLVFTAICLGISATLNAVFGISQWYMLAAYLVAPLLAVFILIFAQSWLNDFRIAFAIWVITTLIASIAGIVWWLFQAEKLPDFMLVIAIIVGIIGWLYGWLTSGDFTAGFWLGFFVVYIILLILGAPFVDATLKSFGWQLNLQSSLFLNGSPQTREFFLIGAILGGICGLLSSPRSMGVKASHSPTSSKPMSMQDVTDDQLLKMRVFLNQQPHSQQNEALKSMVEDELNGRGIYY